MNNEMKKTIDDIWKKTEFGQWVILSAKGDKNNAEKMLKSICEKYPFSLDALERDLSIKIANLITNVNEFDSYMKMLDKEDCELVEFMISHDVFGKVYELK